MKTTIYSAGQFLALILFLGMNFQLHSQTWDYTFGTATGTWNTASGFNTTLLPQPVSGGGSTQLSIGAVAQGSGFYLDNPGLSGFGSGSELRSTASTGVAANKFSIYGYKPSRVFHTAFSVLFGNTLGQSGPKSGDWYFFQGSGALFSNLANASTTLNQSFVSMRFTFSTGGLVRVAYHNGSAWIDISATLPYKIEQGVSYRFEVLANNSSATTDYYIGDYYTLPSGKWDLWINGQLAIAGLSGGGMSPNSQVDSWLFSGEQSTTNFATIFLEDIHYANRLPGSLLPVELVSFFGTKSENGNQLGWQTSSEINNHYFTVEHSTDAWLFSPVTNIEGAGNSNTEITYTYTHQPENTGTSYYRLKQTDYDGTYTYSQVIAVTGTDIAGSPEILSVFPDGAGLSLHFKGNEADYTIRIFSVSGALLHSEHIRTSSGQEELHIPVQLQSGGIYLLQMDNGTEFTASRFLFQ